MFKTDELNKKIKKTNESNSLCLEIGRIPIVYKLNNLKKSWQYRTFDILNIKKKRRTKGSLLRLMI